MSDDLVCHHGSLARSCERCDDEREIADLLVERDLYREALREARTHIETFGDTANAVRAITAALSAHQEAPNG